MLSRCSNKNVVLEILIVYKLVPIIEPEFKTPTKVDIKIKLTPTTKQTVCILCDERNPNDKRYLVHKGVKSEQYLLIEKLLHITITEDEHSDIVCRNCQRRNV